MNVLGLMMHFAEGFHILLLQRLDSCINDPYALRDFIASSMLLKNLAIENDPFVTFGLYKPIESSSMVCRSAPVNVNAHMITVIVAHDG